MAPGSGDPSLKHEDDRRIGSGLRLQKEALPWVRKEESLHAKPHQFINSEEVAREHGVPQKYLVKYLKREIAESDACKSLPFTLLLVISYAAMAIAHDNAVVIRAVEDALEHDIQQNANWAYSGYMGHKGIEEVYSHEDFWKWFTEGLLPLLYIQESVFHEAYLEADPRYTAARKSVAPADRGFWLHYNRIVGGMRLVQERSGEEPCSPSKNPPEILKSLYKIDCVGGTDYNLDPEVGLPNERAQKTIDPVRETWLYIFDDYSRVQEQAKQLELDRWLDRKTKKIEIAIPVYNAEFGVHTLVRVNFYFSRGGHIWKHIIPQSQFADWYNGWYNGLFDAVWCLCLAYVLATEALELRATARQKGALAIFTDYFSFYNLIDWSSVWGGLAIICTFWAMLDLRREMNTYLEEIGLMDMETQREEYVEKLSLYIESLEANVNYVRILRIMLCFYPLIIVVRLFKAFSAQPRLAVVTRTMSRALPDLFHFIIVFGSVFMTFTVCGMVLFGREVSSMTTVARAFMTCFRIAMGDMDWEELSEVGQLWAVIWLWSFIIVVVLLMLNMVIAIIMHNYAEVKEETCSAETLLDEAYQLWTRWNGIRRGTLVPLALVLRATHQEALRAEHAQRQASAARGLASVASLAKALSKSVGDALGRVTDAEAGGADTGRAGEPGEEEEEEMIITVERLIQATARVQNAYKELKEEQAVDLIKGAVEEFYSTSRDKSRREIDELLRLTEKVNGRVKKLTKLTRRAHQLKDRVPVEELTWFSRDLDTYMEEVSIEHEKNTRELEEKKKIRALLQERLLPFPVELLFPPGAQLSPAGAGVRSFLEEELTARAKQRRMQSSVCLAP